jgi:hypothetical protein
MSSFSLPAVGTSARVLVCTKKFAERCENSNQLSTNHILVGVASFPHLAHLFLCSLWLCCVSPWSLAIMVGCRSQFASFLALVSLSLDFAVSCCFLEHTFQVDCCWRCRPSLSRVAFEIRNDSSEWRCATAAAAVAPSSNSCSFIQCFQLILTVCAVLLQQLSHSMVNVDFLWWWWNADVIYCCCLCTSTVTPASHVRDSKNQFLECRPW